MKDQGRLTELGLKEGDVVKLVERPGTMENGWCYPNVGETALINKGVCLGDELDYYCIPDSRWDELTGIFRVVSRAVPMEGRDLTLQISKVDATPEDRVVHCFTFGTSHMSSYPMPGPGRLADYWVEVDLPKDYDKTHREVFMDQFTSYYCPTRTQFAFEYTPGHPIDQSYFPGGKLCTITEAEIE